MLCSCFASVQQEAKNTKSKKMLIYDQIFFLFGKFLGDTFSKTIAADNFKKYRTKVTKHNPKTEAKKTQNIG